MKNSSKIDMEQVFERLANIKTIEPSENLYSITINRINNRNILPLFWVRAAACLFILFVSTELYVILTKEKSAIQNNEIVMIETNNILYNE